LPVYRPAAGKRGKTSRLSGEMPCEGIPVEEEPGGACGRELNCLYSLSNLIATPGIFLAEVLQEALEILPFAFQYPSLASARIAFQDQLFEAADYQESPWRLASELMVRGKRSGRVEVCYRKRPPSAGPTPFLPEEAKLLEVVAGHLSLLIEGKQAEEELKHLATHDPLTDLPTLRLAKDRLNMAISLARRSKTAVAVMFINLDGLKGVNSSLGHEAGDYILIRSAQRLLACVRESDTVARVGGDEFLLVAAGIQAPENAVQIAERVMALLSKPILFKRKQEVIGSARIGIAFYPEDGEETERLIQQAQEAMYEMKKAGKGHRSVKTAVSACP